MDSIDPGTAIQQFYRDLRVIDEMCSAVREVDAGVRTWDSLVSGGLVRADMTEAEVRKVLQPFIRGPSHER